MSVQREVNTFNGISADVPDWSRERPRRFWDPDRKLLLAIRRYQYWRDRSGMVPAFFRKWLVLRHRFWMVVTGADIHLNSRIGGGLMIPHPNEIVVHPGARIGVNCLICGWAIGCAIAAFVKRSLLVLELIKKSKVVSVFRLRRMGPFYGLRGAR